MAVDKERQKMYTEIQIRIYGGSVLYERAVKGGKSFKNL